MSALFWLYLGGSIGATLTMLVQWDVDWFSEFWFLVALFFLWPILLLWAMEDALPHQLAERQKRRSQLSVLRDSSEAKS